MPGEDAALPRASAGPAEDGHSVRPGALRRVLSDLFSRIAGRRDEIQPAAGDESALEPLYSTKAFRKFVARLTSRSGSILLDLGQVVGDNIAFFGERGVKVYVEDLYADLEALALREAALEAENDGGSALEEESAGFWHRRLKYGDAMFDGVICWDVIDYLEPADAQVFARELTRIVRPGGALIGYFSTMPVSVAQYTRFTIVDESNLRRRAQAATRGKRTVLQNRDIIRMFSGLRVSDSYLLHSHLREILFRKPESLSGRS